jgi:6-phosphogluconolactonase
MYTINPATGVLASIGSPVAADIGARSVTVDPLDKSVYVASIGEGRTTGSVSAYTINSTTGALTLTGTINGPCQPLCPWSVTVDPRSKFAYVPNGVGPAPTGVSIFGIDATTGMFASSGSTNVGGRAVSVSVHPSGKFAYVASAFPGDDVYMYTVNTTTGALSPTGKVAVGSSEPNLSMQIVIHPSGNFAYVLGDGCALDIFGGSVSIFSIDPSTGVLTSVGSPAAAGDCARSMAVDPLGKFVYITSEWDNTISMYSINASGDLTSIRTVAAGSGPTSIAIHPSGKFAYVTNSGSNNVSMYRIDAAAGALTLIGTTGT